MGPLAEIRAYLAKNVLDKKAKVINRLNLQGEATTEPDLNFTHLYITDISENAPAPKPLTRGYASFGAATWLPNGQGLLAVTDRDSLMHPDREQDNAIVFIPADGSGRRVSVLTEAGKSYGSPEVSPDGKQLVFFVSPSSGVNYPQINLATLNGSAVSNVQPVTFDRAAGNFTWASTPVPATKGRKTAPGYAVYFTASSNGGIPVYRLDPTTRQVVPLTNEESGVTNFDVVGNQLVFAKTEVANPSELYQADASAKTQTKLSTHNDWVAQRQLSFPEKRQFKNSIGQTVDYWVMKPTRFDASQKYPLLLNMHGGPTAMWGTGRTLYVARISVYVQPGVWHCVCQSARVWGIRY